jgi:hypothetical protein
LAKKQHTKVCYKFTEVKHTKLFFQNVPNTIETSGKMIKNAKFGALQYGTPGTAVRVGSKE